MIALGRGVIHAVKNNGVLSPTDRKPKKKETKNTEKGEEKVEPEPKWLSSK